MNLLIGSKVIFQRKQSNIYETIKTFFEWSTKSSFWTLCQLCCNFGPSNNVIYFFCQTTAYKDKSRNIHDCTFFSRQFQLEIFCCHSGMINLFSNLSKKGWSPVQELEVLVKPACLLWWVISKFCYRLQVHHTLAGTDLLCMLNWGTQWTMVSYLKKQIKIKM